MDTSNPEEPKQPKVKSKRKWLVVLVILLVVAAVAAGVFAYLWNNETQKNARLTSSAETASSKMSSMEKQISDLKSDDQTQASDTPAQSQIEPSPGVSSDADENKTIAATVGAYVHARKGQEGAKVIIQSTKKSAPFARVGVSSGEGPGYACVLKKVDGIWLVLFCGQAAPLQSELDQWGVPKSMLTS